MNGWRASVRVSLGGFRLEVDLQGNGQVLALVGPNGSGKTTLLRALTGAIAGEQAELVVAGRVLESSHQGICLPVEQRRIGYVPQGYGLFPHLTALQNVAFGLSTGPAKLGKNARIEKARSMLRELGCEQLGARRVRELSGGEQQRVALARALVLDPRLLLLDEPLAALDAASRRSNRQFLAHQIALFGRPTVLVTHDARDVQALNAHIAVLEAGRLVQQGTLQSLRSDPASDFVAEFCSAWAR